MFRVMGKDFCRTSQTKRQLQYYPVTGGICETSAVAAIVHEASLGARHPEVVIVNHPLEEVVNRVL